MSAVASPRGRQIRLLGLVGVKKTRKKKSQGMVKRKGGREGGMRVDLAKGTQGSSCCSLFLLFLFVRTRVKKKGKEEN